MPFTKFYLAPIIFFLLLLVSPPSASAFPIYKVALLPIMNTENITSSEIPDLIQYKLHRKLRFPFYEFIPDTDIVAAL